VGVASLVSVAPRRRSDEESSFTTATPALRFLLGRASSLDDDLAEASDSDADADWSESDGSDSLLLVPDELLLLLLSSLSVLLPSSPRFFFFFFFFFFRCFFRLRFPEATLKSALCRSRSVDDSLSPFL